MRRTVLVILASIVVLAVVTPLGLAGIGPNRGLPGVNTVNSTDNNFYLMGTGSPRDNVAGNAGSVMCLKCHTRNPARYTPAGAANDNFLGSHWVTLNFNDTNTGGGYSDGVGVRSGAQYEKTTSWGPSAQLSKYGTSGSVPASQTGTAGQIICESCHNIIKNVGYAKLVDYAKPNAVSTLCVGCHGDMNAGLNAEWQYFSKLGAQTWVGTQHHRNSMSVIHDLWGGATATQITVANHDMNKVGTGYYNQILTGSNVYQMWGADKGELTDATPRTIVFNSTTNKKVKNGPITAGQISTGAIVGGSGYVLICTNCHKTHGSVTGTGATILMTGDTTKTAMGPVVTTQASTTTTAVVRMTDPLPNGRAGMMSDTSPLCLACHQ